MVRRQTTLKDYIKLSHELQRREFGTTGDLPPSRIEVRLWPLSGALTSPCRAPKSAASPPLPVNMLLCSRHAIHPDMCCRCRLSKLKRECKFFLIQVLLNILNILLLSSSSSLLYLIILLLLL